MSIACKRLIGIKWSSVLKIVVRYLMWWIMGYKENIEIVSKEQYISKYLNSTQLHYAWSDLGSSYLQHNHRNGNIVILTKFYSLAAFEVVILTISTVASDKNFVKMIFPFLWWVTILFLSSTFLLMCLKQVHKTESQYKNGNFPAIES